MCFLPIEPSSLAERQVQGCAAQALLSLMAPGHSKKRHRHLSMGLSAGTTLDFPPSLVAELKFRCLQMMALTA